MWPFFTNIVKFYDEDCQIDIEVKGWKNTRSMALPQSHFTFSSAGTFPPEKILTY